MKLAVLTFSLMFGVNLFAEVPHQENNRPRWERGPEIKLDEHALNLLTVLKDISLNGSKTAQRHYSEFMHSGNTFTEASTQAMEPRVTVYRLKIQQCVQAPKFNCLGGSMLHIVERRVCPDNPVPCTKYYDTKLDFLR